MLVGLIQNVTTRPFASLGRWTRGLLLWALLAVSGAAQALERNTPQQVDGVWLYLQHKTLYVHGSHRSIDTEALRVAIRKAVGDDDSITAWHWSNISGGNVSAHQVLEAAAQELDFSYSGPCLSLCANLALEAPRLTAEIRPGQPRPVLMIHGTVNTRINQVVPPDPKEVRHLVKRLKVISEADATLALGGRGHLGDALLIAPSLDPAVEAEMELCLPFPSGCRTIWSGRFKDLGIEFKDRSDIPLPGAPAEKANDKKVTLRVTDRVIVVDGSGKARLTADVVERLASEGRARHDIQAWRWLDFGDDTQMEWSSLMPMAQRLLSEIGGVCVGLCAEVANLAPSLRLAGYADASPRQSPGPTEAGSPVEPPGAAPSGRQDAILWYDFDSVMAQTVSDTKATLRGRIKALITDAASSAPFPSTSHVYRGFFIRASERPTLRAQIQYCEPMPKCRVVWSGDAASLGFEP